MKISIITPSFNQGPFIERTLQSVAIQRHTLPPSIELEHVVFDGGSTDNTAEILTQFCPAVRFTSEQDKGQAHAVNKGLYATNGEIIGWLNSDDIYYPGTLARIAAYFEAHPTIDVVYGMADHIDLHDQAFEAYPTQHWDDKQLINVCFICQPALFFRRRVLTQCGYLDEGLTYCMDYEFWLRLSRKNISFAYIQEKLAGSRLYADNKTLGSRVKVHKEINDMFKTQYGTVPDRWLMNYAHALVESSLIRSQHPHRFVLRLFFAYAAAAWTWNKSIRLPTQPPWKQWGKAIFLSKIRS